MREIDRFRLVVEPFYQSYPRAENFDPALLERLGELVRVHQSTTLSYRKGKFVLSIVEDGLTTEYTRKSGDIDNHLTLLNNRLSIVQIPRSDMPPGKVKEPLQVFGKEAFSLLIERPEMFVLYVVNLSDSIDMGISVMKSPIRFLHHHYEETKK